MPGREYNLKTILSCVDRLSPTLTKVQKSYANMGRSMKAMNRAASNVGRELASFGRSVLAPVSMAMGLLGVSVVGSTKAFAQYADKLAAVSDKSGVATDKLQKLRYAASVNGSSADEMDQALVRLNKTMAEVAAGKNKNAAELFHTLGINIKDANGNIRNASEVLPQLAEAFRLNQDPALQTRMAMDLFGKSGANLIPLMKQGAEGLKKFDERAEHLGLTVSDDAVKAGSDMNNTFTELNQSMTVTAGEITKTLAPVVKNIAEIFMVWLKNNREVIATKLSDWIKALGEAISAVNWDAVKTGLEFLAGAALAIKLGNLASSLINLGKAVTAATGPWGLLIMAVVVAVGFITKNWDKICALTERMGKEISAIFEAMGKDLKETVEKCIGWIKSLIPDDLKKFFEDAWNAITGVFSAAVEKITGLFPDWLKNWFSNGQKEIKVTQEQMPHVKAPAGYSNGEDDDFDDDNETESDDYHETPAATPAKPAPAPAAAPAAQPALAAAAAPAQQGQPQSLVKPNTQAMKMSASGQVSGQVEVVVKNEKGETVEQKKAPLKGGVQVSGNPGTMRSPSWTLDPYAPGAGG